MTAFSRGRKLSVEQRSSIPAVGLIEQGAVIGQEADHLADLLLRDRSRVTVTAACRRVNPVTVEDGIDIGIQLVGVLHGVKVSAPSRAAEYGGAVLSFQLRIGAAATSALMTST